MVKKNGAACPCQPDDMIRPPVLPITPIVSVRSVNGSNGDVVLNKLTVGEKEYNGDSAVEITASDLGLNKAFVYYKQVSTVLEAQAIMGTASTGLVLYCAEDKMFYLSVGEGEYKKFMTSAELDQYATKVEVAAKQDKLTAGSNITITDNVISSTAVSKLTSAFTVTNTVGNISTGTVLAEGTTFEEILKAMLTAPPAPTSHDVYFGGLSTLPTSEAAIDSLTKTTQNVTDMQAGVATNIATDEQYVTIAYKSEVGTINSITEDGFEALSDFSNQFTFGEYKFYCTADKVYDPEAEINFVVKWSIS